MADYYYREVATGEVLGAKMSKPQDADWIARYAEALGVGEVVQFSAETDVRPANPKTEPAPEPTPEETEREAVLAILEKDNKDVTADELKTLVLTDLRKRMGVLA